AVARRGGPSGPPLFSCPRRDRRRRGDTRDDGPSAPPTRALAWQFLPRQRCYRVACMRTVWDISPPIAPATPVFPGDTPYSQQWTARIGPACPVNVSAITMSAHLGAHADAPLHYSMATDARPIGEVSLEPFLGPCRVI